jgi:hypothetical protein
MLCQCARTNSRQGTPRRVPTGPSPPARSHVRTVVADTVTPSPLSSPTIRCYPHRGFSRARRTTRPRTCRRIPGRPARRGQVQRFATKRRCQRSSVVGVIMKDRQRVRGRSWLAPAKNMRSIVVIAGRRVCRRRVASSCRSTTISNSLKSCERQRKTANWRMGSKEEVTERIEHGASGGVRCDPILRIGLTAVPLEICPVGQTHRTRVLHPSGSTTCVSSDRREVVGDFDDRENATRSSRRSSAPDRRRERASRRR